MQEPGLDRHDYETEWQALEPLVRDAPAEALSELDDLVGRMLAGRGYALDDDVAASGEEPEIVAEFRSARELTRLLEGGADVSPGDVGAAVEGYRTVYGHLMEQRPAP